MKLNYSFIPLLGIATALLNTHVMADNAADIENNDSGQVVTYDGAPDAYPVISAVLSAPGTLDGYTYKNWSFLAQDATGSLDMFASSSAATFAPSGYTPTVGDSVTVTGTYAPYQGLPEVSTPSFTTTQQSSGAAPGATVVTIPQINLTAVNGDNLLGNYAGYYVQLDDVTIGGAPTDFPTHANGTYTVSDTDGNSMVLYFWASSYSSTAAYGGTTVPTGEVDMDGFVDFYAADSEAEFIPTTITTVAAVPEPSVVSLCGVGSALAWISYRFRKKA